MANGKITIKKVGVLGAGVMGGGIAAHLANAGVDVVLLDIVPEGAENRNVIAEGAIQKLLRADPAPFMHKKNARRITTGNMEDNLALLEDADWIIEVVLEHLGIKQGVYEKLETIRKPGCIVSSNTSTIPLEQLVDGRSDEFKQHFAITHFFNPPRYMRLLEIVKGADTKPEVIETLDQFCSVGLGKGVVYCNDTPGFIGNRIGGFWMQAALNEAIDAKLTPEEADAVMGRPIGVPKSGIFALLDLVGLDLMPHVLKSLLDNLPESDSFHAGYRDPEMVNKMVAEGYTGRKGKGGFYRLNTEGGGRVKEVRDLETGEYYKARKPRLSSVRAAKKGLQVLVTHPDKGGQYAWKVLSKTLSYACEVAEQIGGSVVAVDDAMKLGYGWKWGPFEMIDRMGPAWLAGHLKEHELAVPALLEKVGDGTFYKEDGKDLLYLGFDGKYTKFARRPGELRVEDLKRGNKPVFRNGSASIWDMGDDVLLVEFHSKLNALDPDSLTALGTMLQLVPKMGKKGAVIGNDASNFSAGANIGLMLFAANIAQWGQIDEIIASGQKVMLGMKYAPFPIVAAPSGMAIGGGCEVLLHCDAIQAHAESYVGLVEFGVGVVPAWGGSTALLARWLAKGGGARSSHQFGFPTPGGNGSFGMGGTMPAIRNAFETIGTAKVAKSAAEAMELGFLRSGDGVSMNRDRVLADAKAKVLQLSEGYEPPEPPKWHLPGPSGYVAMMLAVDGFVAQGLASQHDRLVSEQLATIISGGDTDIMDLVGEKELHDLERAAFMHMVRTEKTLERIEHMLNTGKPLRN